MPRPVTQLGLHSYMLGLVSQLIATACVQTMVVYLCVCRYLRTFINLPLCYDPYLVGVVSFLDVLAEDKFKPTVALDKLIVFDLPKFSGYFWQKMKDVKVWDMLTYVKHPQCYPNCSPPPFFLIPPGVAPPPTTEDVPTFFLR